MVQVVFRYGLRQRGYPRIIFPVDVRTPQNQQEKRPCGAALHRIPDRGPSGRIRKIRIGTPLEQQSSVVVSVLFQCPMERSESGRIADRVDACPIFIQHICELSAIRPGRVAFNGANQGGIGVGWRGGAKARGCPMIDRFFREDGVSRLLFRCLGGQDPESDHREHHCGRSPRQDRPRDLVPGRSKGIPGNLQKPQPRGRLRQLDNPDCGHRCLHGSLG